MASKCKTEEKQGQGSIRGTIHLLSSLLTECGIPRVPSECFRKAKFNQLEHALEDLWKLIFHVMQAIQFLEQHCNDTLEDINFYTVTNVNLPMVQVILQRYLFELGYEREEMFVNACSVGSRELLLVLAWLLNKTSFFKKLTKHFMTIASSTVIPLKPVGKNLVEYVIEENQKIGLEMDSVVSFFKDLSLEPSVPFSRKRDYEEALHKLIWLKGHVDHKQRSMLRSCLAYHKLADRIHKATCDGSLISRRREGVRGHLSIHEVFLLRHPNQMKAYLNRLEHCIKVLHKLILWKDSEPLFWQWMESVIDLDEEEEERLKRDNPPPQSSTKLSDVEALVTKLDELQKKFKVLVERNQVLIEKLNHVWKHRSRILPHKDIYIEEQCITKQLQYEYPIVAVTANQTSNVISMLEKLTPIESCVYIPIGSIPGKHTHQAFPTLAQQQRETDSKLLNRLQDHIRTITQELTTLNNSIAQEKLDIRNALESLEKTLPATVYRIESNVILAECGNKTLSEHP